MTPDAAAESRRYYAWVVPYAGTEFAGARRQRFADSVRYELGLLADVRSIEIEATGDHVGVMCQHVTSTFIECRQAISAAASRVFGNDVSIGHFQNAAAVEARAEVLELGNARG